MRLDTALLVVGRGPAALVVAKVAGACGQPCLLVGSEVSTDDAPVVLTPDAVAVLEEHGLVDVLRPALHGRDPLTIAPLVFTEIIKQHCVADVNVTVYDDVALVDQVADGSGRRGVLTDGTSRWELHADVVVDADELPTALAEAIVSGAAAALEAISVLVAPRRG